MRRAVVDTNILIRKEELAACGILFDLDGVLVTGGNPLPGASVFCILGKARYPVTGHNRIRTSVLRASRPCAGRLPGTEHFTVMRP